mmetsp:Transcript_9682/g.24318  ORF Transcript_9682/g.24318 Transcript_9682/m.24318 type:complete len:788 (+) Transcript_9682:2-2365(+)
MVRSGLSALIAAICIAASTAAAPIEDACATGEVASCIAARGGERDEVQLLQERLSLNSRLHRTQTADAHVAASEVNASQKLDSIDLGIVAATTTSTTTESADGLTLNGVGDLVTLLSGIAMYGFLTICCVLFFSYARLSYPMIYTYNAMSGLVDPMPADTMWGWVRASMNVKVEEVIESIGLDNAMMLEFCNLMMRILATIGIPMICIIGPMNWAFGGNAAGEDHLSYLSFGNVEFYSWLYWVHAPCVWGVVFVVQINIFSAQRRFLRLRYEWLRKMANLRANTVMVDNIPEEFQSDAKLGEFFERIIPGDKNVKVAHVTKDTTHLLHLVTELKQAEDELQKAKAMFEKNKEDGNGRRPRMGGICCGGRDVDSIDYYTKIIEDLRPKVEEERKRVLTEAEKVGGVNLNNGFVVFNDLTSAQVAVRLTGITEDYTDFIVEDPPEPLDIQWADFTQDPTARQGRTILGYALTAALFFAYMPLVVTITNVAELVDLGPLESVWSSVAPTAGLQIMVAFLPTFLIHIYKHCFTLRAAAWAQHKLQSWYFWFQMMFVVLLAAVGTNVAGFTEALFTDPFSMFGVLADTMPYATHYYMNYLVLSWLSQSMVLTRYVVLSKFKFFCQIFDEEEAKKWAEPEDQDYFGIGSRSAQWVTFAVVGIVYGTLSPPINFFCFITFALKRLYFGYLLVFAEGKKPDLGGVFWVMMLRHMFVGLLLYTILMTGVFYRRAANSGPMLICLPSMFYVIWSMQRFQSSFQWEKLPFKELTEESTMDAEKRTLDGRYLQPELIAS